MQAYLEMDAWAWVPVQDFINHFDTENHKNDPFNNKDSYNMTLDGQAFKVRGAAYRSFQAFAKRHFNFNNLLNRSQLSQSIVQQIPPSERVKIPSMSNGIRAIQNELKQEPINHQKILDILSGKNGSILERAPTKHEFPIMVRAINTVANDNRQPIDDNTVNIMANDTLEQRAHKIILKSTLLLIRDIGQNELSVYENLDKFDPTRKIIKNVEKITQCAYAKCWLKDLHS
ncbi:MAG: hypothetical protein K2X98_02825 [Alphaproteobacteria bacterium]|nr:hypothetical protein [Alphaproteobacteria bacterium]